MRRLRFWKNKDGASALEFALTVPMFFMMLFGLLECALILWTQMGLQHGAEKAARCASINTTTCGTTSNIQTYALAQSFGLNVPSSTFVVSSTACGSQVSASYAYPLLTHYFGTSSITLTASSCFPK
jgi:Flp pilus assembly protein TadG